MRHKTFFWFILPSLAAMFLFIALPLVSVVVQSLHIEHEQVIVVTENCGPFGCKQESSVDTEATEQLRAEKPLGRFAGLSTYFDRGHLATAEIAEAWRTNDSFGDFFGEIFNLPFYKALTFTLAYTFIVTPLVIVLGLLIALGVNRVTPVLKGPTIFVSLLPMMITPLVGSLILFWMIDAQGVIGKTLQFIFDDPELSLKASPALTWITLMVYGVWSSAPFAFVVFYAGLQTVNTDSLEAAQIDGASRWQQIRFVVIPHLMPLVVFISLIQLMDNFKVFEPVIGFKAGANAPSLSYIIFADMRSDIIRYNSAAATSVLTVLGVAILLSPVLLRTWRDFKGKAV
ncbi:carbohydrate ABC transporter permease [Cognatishimia maritima]|uniref:ABC-type sugar transport system, permease component n=1 Tax=Cognatishimia maritima TaxID=870908 RepID=A0A1M5NYB9_9RHOB|nr:sugar ABC transporter permease [Cognatishimia maritima]SHG94465.1 ABC-type sugar transport system, permease component [Cognatishimia maritima]